MPLPSCQCNAGLPTQKQLANIYCALLTIQEQGVISFPLSPSLGGTGVANADTETLTINGGFPLAFTLTGATSLTLPASGTLISQILTGLTVWVDSVNGNDSTGARGRQDLPFLTPTAAKTAAISGDTIYVRPGAYTTAASLAKNGVNWDFEAGATVSTASNSVGIWDDAGGAATFAVTGHGVFTASGSANTLNITQSGSSVIFFCDLLEQTNTGATSPLTSRAALLQTAGTLYVEAVRISSYRTAVYWDNGAGHIRANVIETTGGGAAVYGLNALANQHWYVTADHIHATGGTAIDVSGDASARVWVEAKRITSSGASIVQTGAVLYVSAQKLQNTDVGVPVIVLDSGELHLNAQKVEGGDANDELGGMTLGGGLSFIQIGQYVDTNIAGFPAVTVSGGEHNIEMLIQRSAGGDGVLISGGTLRLKNSRIDTSAGSSSNPIRKSGGTLKAYGCTLVSQGARNAIEAATAQTVSLMGCWSNNALDADVTNNITGGLNTDSDVS